MRVGVAVALLLGGCGPMQWEKPGGTRVMFDADDKACLEEAATAVLPEPAEEPADTGADNHEPSKAIRPMQTVYVSAPECTASSEILKALEDGADWSVVHRQLVHQVCLYSRGWTYRCLPASKPDPGKR